MIELHCTYDPITKSGTGFKGRNVKGTIHWIAAHFAKPATVHLYDNLIANQDVLKENTLGWEDKLNPLSLVVLKGCLVEQSVANALPETKFQFIRHGYFNVDPRSAVESRPVFNRIVHLKDSWKKN